MSSLPSLSSTTTIYLYFSLVAREGETFSKSSENSDGLFTSSVTTSIKGDLVGKEDLAVCNLEMPGFDVHMRDELPLLEEESKSLQLNVAQ